MSDIKRVNVNGSGSIINPDYDAKLNHTDASLFTAGALSKIAGYNPANGINMQNAVDVLAKKQAITPYVKDYSDSDLSISDESGYVLARFNNGHFQTLNFDSRKTTDSSFIKYNPELNGTDSSLFSVEELQKINGYDSKYGITVQNTIDILANKHIELEEESKKHPYIDDKLYDSDLDISDENGNIIAQFANGHFQTLNFDSSLITNKIKTLENTEIQISNTNKCDFEIVDSSGYVIMRIADGNIKTKNFNSADSGQGGGSSSGYFYNQKLRGKKISFIGDSITTYLGYTPSEYLSDYDGAQYKTNGANPSRLNNSVHNSWWMKLIDNTETELSLNCAWSGSKVTGNSSSTTSAEAGCSTRRITDLSWVSIPDIIIILIGINDFGANVQMGNWTAGDTIPTDGNITTFSEAYALMVAKCLQYYPHARVFCCTLV